MVYVVADDLRVISAPGGEEDLGKLIGLLVQYFCVGILTVCDFTTDSLGKSDGAQWWFTSMFGALLGTFLRVGRSGKRIEPMPPPSSESLNEEETDQKKEPTEAPPAFLPASTQFGKLLHETFDDSLCLRYENVFVNQRGYRTVMMVRWMTPQIFREVAGIAEMPKSHMDRLREAIAPPDFEARNQFPIFSSY